MRQLPKLKAVGSQGSYFAKIGEEDVACVWTTGLTKMHYLDDGAQRDGGQWPRYIEAIRTMKKVALTRVKRDEGGAMRRDGYVALYRVENVTFSDRGLEFDLVERLAEL